MPLREPIQRGFSLLELLTALLIASLLVTLALPAWQTREYRIERSAALAGLQQAAQCQGRRSAWASTAVVDPDPACLPPQSATYRYLAVRTGDRGSARYEWRAEPRGRQRADACGTLVLDDQGRRSVLGTAESALRCWQGR